MTARDPAPVAAAWLPRAAVILCFSVIAVGVSSLRFTPGPGFEFYLAPFFFLLATHWFGLRVGLPATIVLMLPTWLWWGHPYSILTAALYIVVVDRLRRQRRSFTEATLIYYLLIGFWIGLLFLHTLYGVPAKLSAVIILRKLANDALCAALADFVLVYFRFDSAVFQLKRRPTMRIGSAMLASMTLFVVTTLSYLLLDEIRDFDKTFRSLRNRITTEVAFNLHHEESSSRGHIRRTFSLPLEGIDVPVMISPTPLSVGDGTELTRTLRCTTLDHQNSKQLSEKLRFDFWVNACQTGVARVHDQKIYFATSLRKVALSAYEEILLDLTGYLLLVLIGLGCYLQLRRRLDRSVKGWATLIAEFGTPNLSVPSVPIFHEFREAMDLFVRNNNRYVGAIEEREALDQARWDLKRAIDLTIASDIRYCAETGRISFLTFEQGACPKVQCISVHEADRQSLANVSAMSEVMVEFRMEDRPQSEWYMLVGRGLQDGGFWRAGFFLKLRQAKLAEDQMAHQARLTELGGMASALSHELKQPLFTIALAAENGLFQIGEDPAPMAQALARKFTRIEEQVERARVIIDRISRYARIDDQKQEPFELKAALTAATNFVRPLLVRSNVRLAIRFMEPTTLLVRMPRVGLEQIVVNAVQNSLDAIVARRERSGEHPCGDRIDITVVNAGSALEIRLEDTGTGLISGADRNAFDPFFTTKPAGQGTGLGLYISRQIMMEVGGSIRIANRDGGGAVVTLAIPAEAIAAPAQTEMEATEILV
jgi:two-component system, NtrC family, C4-dicarboxylate transport sensor histidine kinase DctB